VVEEGVQTCEGGEVDRVRRVEGQGLRGEGAQAQVDGALYYARADAGYGALDYLVARRAEDEGAARVDGGEEGVAVFEAVLEVYEGFAQLGEEPVKLPFLRSGRGGGQC